MNHPRWEPSAKIGHARMCAGCSTMSTTTRVVREDFPKLLNLDRKRPLG
jgi:hypothetical protein